MTTTTSASATQIPNTATPLPPVKNPTAAPLPATATGTPVFSPTPGVWVELPKMLISRSEMPAAVIRRRIYVAGGFGHGFNKNHEMVLEAYDIDSSGWARLANLPFQVNHHGLVAFNDQLYLFPDFKLPVLRYDPAEDRWFELNPMPESRYAGSAVVLGDFIYYVGGAGGSRSILRYDPADDSWEILDEMRRSREHTQAGVFDGGFFSLLL